MQHELEGIGMEFAQGNDVIESNRDIELEKMMNTSNLEFNMDSGKVVRSNNSQDENSILQDKNIGTMVVTYNENTYNDTLDFGSVTLIDSRTDKRFVLQVLESHRNGNELECIMENIQVVIDEEDHDISNFKLTQSDFSSPTISAHGYFNKKGSMSFTSAKLKLFINGRTIVLDVSADKYEP